MAQRYIETDSESILGSLTSLRANLDSIKQQEPELSSLQTGRKWRQR